MIFILFMILIDPKGVSSQTRYSGPPDMCLHSSRFSSITQFSFIANSSVNFGYFLTSGGYYWIFNDREYATPDNTGGVLPFGFRGDASFFRLWKRCENQKTVPMIVLVDNTSPKYPQFRYLIYFLETQSWSDRPSDVKDDIALKHVKLYPGIATIDTIINMANIRDGPYAGQLGDESLFVLSTATNKSMFYDWVSLTDSCFANNNTNQRNGRPFPLFGGPLERALWKIDKSVDAAMVYINYDESNAIDITYADISLFQGNTHYVFNSPLDSIKQGILFCNKTSLLAQYYSTWMDCAQGLTPEPPYNPFLIKLNPKSKFSGLNTTEPIDENTWRPVIPHHDQMHNTENEDHSTLWVAMISGIMVLIVGSVVLGLSVITYYKHID